MSTSLGGISKLSLHSPDDCQFGFDKKFREQKGYGRHLAGFPTFIRWKRRRAEEGQAVPLAILYFPTDYLKTKQSSPQNRKSKFQTAFKPAPAGQCVELLLAAIPRPENADGLKANGAHKLLCWMPLGQDEWCILLARYCAFSPENIPVNKQIQLPDEWMNAEIRALRPGEQIEDQNLQVWTHPSDFEEIRIFEMTGTTLTKNSSREMPRDPKPVTRGE